MKMKTEFVLVALLLRVVSSNLTCTNITNNCSTFTLNCPEFEVRENFFVEVTNITSSNDSCTFIATTSDTCSCSATTTTTTCPGTEHSTSTFDQMLNLVNATSCLDINEANRYFIDKLIKCEERGILCLLLASLGIAILLLLIIILVLCVVITCLVARGKRYKYTPNVVLTQSSAEQNQIQEQQPLSQPQNQDSGGQQANLYHILDPQYETVDNKTKQPRSEPTSEPVQYCEPEPSTHVQAEVTEHMGLTGSGSQPSKLKASLEQIDEQDTGVFYDELTGPGYPKSLKSSEHSATSLPTAVPKYSSLHMEGGTEQEQKNELITLYSIPDKNKKKEKDSGKKLRETELTTLQSLMVRSPTESKPPFTLERKLSGQGGDIRMVKPKSPSPPPPELPPKPGQASSVAENTQEELEDEESAYAEVSSRPITSAPPRNRTPGAIGTTVSPLHLTSHNPSSTEKEKGSFRRSYSMEGYFGSEALRHQKASDFDFHRLYDAPMTPSLHTRRMEPPQEDEEERHGFIR